MRRTKYTTIEFDVYIDDPDGMDLSSEQDDKFSDICDEYAEAVCNGLADKLNRVIPNLNVGVKYHY